MGYMLMHTKDIEDKFLRFALFCVIVVLVSFHFCFHTQITY